MTIEYYREKKEVNKVIFVVDKIKKYKGRRNPIYYNLLPIDKELLE